MKSFQMKALALATLGLGGLVMAGSAFAACPTVSAGNASPGGGGAWSSQTVAADASMSIVSPGLNSTSCALQLSISAGAASNTKSYVTDQSPNNEARYRARFYMDISGLTGLSASNQQIEIFDAFADTAPGTDGTDEVQIYLIGNTAVRFFLADQNIAGDTKVITATLPTVVSGKYRIEFDLQGGNPGSFRYWVTDAAVTTSDGSPTGTWAPNNAGWSGITAANLGLYSTSAQFRSGVSGQNFLVDEFDSRRQTFIGQ